MIKWIFFDVGSTLVDETATYQRFVHECVKVLRLHEKQVTEIDFFSKMQEIARIGVAPIKAAWAWYGLSDDARPRWSHVGETLYDGVFSMLDYLAQRYRLGIIANQDKGLAERLESFGIRHFFEIIVCSEEVGYKKPDRAIFDYALRQAKSAADECIYVGDRMDNDILPAKAVGMRTVHVLQGIGPHDCHSTDSGSDVTIKRLGDLLNLV